jgi:ribosomal protein L7Ae-like RNA K-turn-binding protein
MNLALKARLLDKVRKAPRDKTLKPGTSQVMK